MTPSKHLQNESIWAPLQACQASDWRARNQWQKASQMTPVKQKGGASTPGIEPGIFRSVGGRLIHWAMRNEAQEDFMQNWMHSCQILRLYT